MQFRLTPIFLFLTLAAPTYTYAGVIEDLESVFDSGFEGREQCARFDGFDDIIDIPTVTIAGDFTLNGVAFPVSEYDDGEISLRDRVTGDVILLGSTHTPGYTANIVPGHYDVLYSVQTPGALAPWNTGAVIMENVSLFADSTLDVNVIAHLISGTYQLNGVNFPASQYDHGDFLLDGKKTGRVDVGDSKWVTFSNVPVVEGDYEIRFHSIQSDSVPVNEYGLVGELSVTGDAGALQFNVQTTALNGAFTNNGQPFPVSEYDDGRFFLETVSGDRVFLENSHFNGYEKIVMTGLYDAYWEVQTPGDTVPFNTRARIGTNLEVIRATTLDLNVISHSLTGNITQNGGAFPNSVLHTGQIVLRDEVAGRDSVLAQTKDGAYEQVVVQGTYQIVYQYLQGENVPQNQNATINPGVLFNGGDTFDIDVPVATFSASVYQNNFLFPADPGQQGNILLRNLASDDVALLGKTSKQQLSARMIPGTYDAYYSHLAGDNVPQNQMGLFQENVVVPEIGLALDGTGGGGGFSLDVTSTIIAGTFNVGGNPVPVSEYDDGLISLHWDEDFVLLGNTHDETFLRRVLVAPYQIHYQRQTVGDLMPVNGNARISCARLAPPIT